MAAFGENLMSQLESHFLGFPVWQEVYSLSLSSVHLGGPGPMSSFLIAKSLLGNGKAFGF